MKGKDHVITFIDAEKAFYKMQLSFMVKLLTNLVYLNIIKGKYERPTANIIFNNERLEALALNIGNRTRVPRSPLLFSTVLEVLDRMIKQEKEIKDIHIRKDEVKLSLFADDVILYIENPKDFNKKLIELINKFNNIAGYKINI